MPSRKNLHAMIVQITEKEFCMIVSMVCSNEIFEYTCISMRKKLFNCLCNFLDGRIHFSAVRSKASDNLI